MKLIAEGLTSIRGGRTLFAGLSFAVGAGEALLLLGPNGAGKTTLIRTIAGLLGPAAGTIRLEGGDAERSVGEQCHYVGHLNAVKSSLTVEENATFWCRFLGGRRDGLDAALAAFGLAALRDIPAAYLSAGQKRRLGLARVLLADRPIWLLDEPTVSLDRAAQEVLAARRGRAPRRGRPGDRGHARAARLVQCAGAASRRHGRGSMSAFWHLVRRDLLRRLEGGRHRRRGARLLPGGGDAAAARHRARPQPADPHRAGHAVGGAAAGGAAVARPHVRDRLRGRLAGGAGDRPAAARGGRRRQEPRPLADDRRSPDPAGAAAGPVAQPAAGGLRRADAEHAGRHAGRQLRSAPSARPSPCARAAAGCCWRCSCCRCSCRR